MTTTTFQEMLREYFDGPPSHPRYWQKFKERMWRLCGSKAYKGQRDAVLERRRKRYKNGVQKSLIYKEFVKRDYVMRNVAKDASWLGGNLVVPFRPGVRVEPSVFAGHHKAWK